MTDDELPNPKFLKTSKRRSKEDILFIKENYKSMTTLELSKVLNRIAKAIRKVKESHGFFTKLPNEFIECDGYTILNIVDYLKGSRT